VPGQLNIPDEGFIPFPSAKCHVIDVDWGKLIHFAYGRQTLPGIQFLASNFFIKTRRTWSKSLDVSQQTWPTMMN